MIVSTINELRPSLKDMVKSIRATRKANEEFILEELLTEWVEENYVKLTEGKVSFITTKTVILNNEVLVKFDYNFKIALIEYADKQGINLTYMLSDEENNNNITWIMEVKDA